MLYDYHTLRLLGELIVEEYEHGEDTLEELASSVREPDYLLEPVLSPAIPDLRKIPVVLAPLPVEAVQTKGIPEALRMQQATGRTFPGTDSVAIIGMSGRFPGAATLEAFWNNLREGRDSITEVPDRKWVVPSIFSAGTPLPGKSYSKWMGVLEDEDHFDPLFFGITPREAERMDPQQRVFLEESWRALEDAGYHAHNLPRSRCGVFVGVSPGDYSTHFNKGEMDTHVFTGMSSSILASRISYHLDLHGPAVAVDTACSSSLVAIHQACTSLKTGESELALAGGVCIMTTDQIHVLTSQAGMLSKDGKCYTFDERANGFVPGEGVGVLVLKKLDQAVADGDHIYGVIRGSGINQDGKTNGITAPSFTSQTRLEKEVYERAGVKPEGISYVEAHGTGTKLGDPIEVKALKESFGKTKKTGYCALGSVKTNIGHALAAAGVAGMMSSSTSTSP
jgi:acyl transferase domain-containing protein